MSRLQLPGPRTPLYPLVKQRVTQDARPIVERLQAWRMMGAANGLDTTRSDGTPLRFRGITFEGTPRAIFWSGFFEPFMVDAARQSIQWVLDECRSRELDHGPYVLEVRALIRLLVDRAYEDMASTDQLLLGNGDPTSVARVNVADQITTMQSHVDELVAALTHHGEKGVQRDDLTQLSARGSFDRDLTAAVDDTRRQNASLSLIFGDIDHFKRVNDTNGHQAGDEVLREVAARLIRVVRGKGTAYRYGGEELVVILHNHATAEGLAVAERFRLEIEGESIDGIAVTVSVGVACFPDHAADSIGLVRAADQALYDAKRLGRNLVRFSGEPAPTSTGPREPERKAPRPGWLNEERKVDLRQRLLRGERVTCPDDGAFLEVTDITPEWSIRRMFVIMCPECGSNERL